ncbi:hypothetical protein [Comamonas sp. JC664]|uniref:hypothetical protein n=1 Tax=Comamonas sp. JC664 TaxID=2801917 RepID=UPI00174DDDF1|nr:hypothetical protein [Comamonas sp. JC664]MBL0696870.1 hypothetical protein [Comamonas sp. JC664]
MRLSATWFSWMCIAALGATACGGTELEEAPALEGERQVEQFKYYAYCETDAYGYQTGRCIDFHSYAYCADAPLLGCHVGARAPISRVSAACGTYVNDSNCDGKYLPDLIEM